MKVKSVRLVNLRSFVDQEIEFSENINLLVGANNSGKSTIVKAMLNLQYEHVFEVSDIRSTHKDLSVWSKIALAQGDIIPISGVFDEDHAMQVAEMPLCFTALFELKRYNGDMKFSCFDSNLNFKFNQKGEIELWDNTGKSSPLKHFIHFKDRVDYKNFIYPYLSRRKTDYLDSNVNEALSLTVGTNFRNITAKLQVICNNTYPKNQ